MSSASHFDRIETAFRNLQVKNSELEEEVREKHAENTELKAQIRASKKEKTRSKAEQRKARAKAKAAAALGTIADGDAADAAQLEPKENEPFLMGKKFLIGGAMWVESPSKLFQAPLAPPPFAFDDVARYNRSIPNWHHLGHLADLYHVVLPRLHDKMASPVEFQEEFKRGYEQRPSFLFTLRQHAVQIFQGLDPRYYSSTNYNMRREPECAKYLKWDVESTTYPDDPPYLYPNFQRVLSKKYRSPWLINVIRCWLTGPGSISQDFETSHIPNGTPPRNFEKWDLRQVNGNVIASAASTIDHFLSPASTFKAQNGVFNLSKRFDNYQEYFIRGKDNPAIQATLQYINNAVFGGLTQSVEEINIDTEEEAGESQAQRELRELAEETAAAAAAATAASTAATSATIAATITVATAANPAATTARAATASTTIAAAAASATISASHAAGGPIVVHDDSSSSERSESSDDEPVLDDDDDDAAQDSTTSDEEEGDIEDQTDEDNGTYTDTEESASFPLQNLNASSSKHDSSSRALSSVSHLPASHPISRTASLTAVPQSRTIAPARSVPNIHPQLPSIPALAPPPVAPETTVAADHVPKKKGKARAGARGPNTQPDVYGAAKDVDSQPQDIMLPAAPLAKLKADKKRAHQPRTDTPVLPEAQNEQPLVDVSPPGPKKPERRSRRKAGDTVEDPAAIGAPGSSKTIVGPDAATGSTTKKTKSSKTLRR